MLEELRIFLLTSVLRAPSDTYPMDACASLAFTARSTSLRVYPSMFLDTD